jgi:hypothetical protein
MGAASESARLTRQYRNWLMCELCHTHGRTFGLHPMSESDRCTRARRVSHANAMRRISRPWLAMGFRCHEGFALLDGGPLARIRVGNRAGVRPRFRDVAVPARELTDMGVCGFNARLTQTRAASIFLPVLCFVVVGRKLHRPPFEQSADLLDRWLRVHVSIRCEVAAHERRS